MAGDVIGEGGGAAGGNIARNGSGLNGEVVKFAVAGGQRRIGDGVEPGVGGGGRDPKLASLPRSAVPVDFGTGQSCRDLNLDQVDTRQIIGSRASHLDG